MSLESCFEVSEEDRTTFIDNCILRRLPTGVRECAKERTIKIVNFYAGHDLNALSILAYATERKRFDEFAEKLEQYFLTELSYIHPEARIVAHTPGAVRAERFFLDCYESLGV